MRMGYNGVWVYMYKEGGVWVYMYKEGGEGVYRYEEGGVGVYMNGRTCTRREGYRCT